MILFAVSLGVAPLTNEIWEVLAFMCIGVGIGNGVLMPCMSVMGADFSDDDNRGTVLGYITVGNQSAFIVGPLIMGAVYAIDPDLIFYVGAAFVAVGFIPIALLLAYWPSTRKPKEFDRMDHISEIDEFIKHPETWEYAADKPTNREYNKLGKDFGKMLIERGYLAQPTRQPIESIDWIVIKNSRAKPSLRNGLSNAKCCSFDERIIQRRIIEYSNGLSLR